MSTQEQDLLARMAQLDSAMAEAGQGPDLASQMAALDAAMGRPAAPAAPAPPTLEERVVPVERPEDFGRPAAPDLGDFRAPPSPAAARLIAARNLRTGRVPPLASLETPEQREEAAASLTPAPGSRTTPGLEAREEISEQDRRMAEFTALGTLPPRDPDAGPDLGRDLAEIPGVSPILGGAASLGDLLMQIPRMAGSAAGRETGALSRESLDRFQDRRAEERAVREESTGAMNRLRRTATFGTRVAGEVAMIELALAAAVPALSTTALVGEGVGRVGTRVAAREAGVGAASEGGVALLETEGDVKESARRAAFGGVAGAAAGLAFGRLAGRSARRATARELAEGAGEAAEEVSEQVVRRLGSGPANEGVITRPDRLLPASTTPAGPLDVQAEIQRALQGQADQAPAQIPARTGPDPVRGSGRAGRGAGGQTDLGAGRESLLEQAQRLSRTADARPKGTTGAAAEAIQRAEVDAAEAAERGLSPAEQAVAEEIKRTGIVPDNIPESMRGVLTPGARVPGVAEAAPFPAVRPDPVGEVLASEREVLRGVDRRAQNLAFEGAERRTGDRRNLPGASVGGELQEVQRIARQADEARLNNTLSEGPGGDRGGFVVDPRRDVLESAIPRGASPELREVLERVSVGDKPRRFKIPTWTDFMTAVVDRTFAIKKVGRTLAEGLEGLGRMDMVDLAARLSSGAARRAESFLRSGGGRWTADGNWVKTGTRGLMPILSDMKGKLPALRGYLLSKRTGEVAGRGIKQSIKDATGRTVVRQTEQDVREAASEITRLLDDALAYYAEAAGVPLEQLTAMRAAGQFYIPLDKVFEGVEGVAIKGGGGQGAPIQKLGSSDRDFIDPLESAVDYIKRTIRAGDDQRILRNLGELVERDPTKALELGIQEVPLKYSTRAEQAAENLIRTMDDEGITITMQQALDTVNPLLPRVSEVGDTFTAWVGGQRRTYRIPPNVAKAFLSMNPSSGGVVRQMLRLPATGLRAGVTLNPVFQVVNGWRDMLTAMVQSQYGFNPLDMGRGFWESSKANWFGKASEQYSEFVAGGGGFSGLSRGQDRLTNQEALQALIKGGEPVTGPVSLLKKFAVPWEEAARIGEYMKARGAGAGVADAVLASQDVTVNFQQMGASMAAMSQMTAFMNAGIQSMDVMVRTAGRAAKNPAPFLMYGVGGMAVPSAMLWFANKDDQDIQDLRKTQQGQIYWFVRDPMDSEGAIFRIPKPFVWGQIFGTMPEAALDRMFAEDPEAVGRFGEALLGQAMFAFIPNVAQIPIEQWANKDLFFQSDLVPAHLDRFEPQMQVNERTSKIAQTISRLSGVVRDRVPGADLVPGGEFMESPIRVDAMLRDLGGTLTSEGMRAVDIGLDALQRGDATVQKPALGRGEMPFFNRFVARNPSLGSEPVQTFWDAAIPAQQAVDSYKELVDTGRDAEAQDLFRRRGPELLSAVVYTSSRAQISEIRKAIEEIKGAPDSLFGPDTDVPARKRELIDRYTQQYVEITRAANEAVGRITIAAEERAEARAAGAPPGG